MSTTRIRQNSVPSKVKKETSSTTVWNSISMPLSWRMAPLRSFTDTSTEFMVLTSAPGSSSSLLCLSISIMGPSVIRRVVSGTGSRK
ncbi:MAG: hypothetical protein A4E39_00126 [Methanoregulaceae archaeon PtaB.Bin152]|nr:MAG: hypothetical protein A4E39_00126 [Methanoregulaceae archaeon PtaB.Bin152]